jgi:chromate reductase
MPETAKLEIFDLEGIPPFTQDLENNMPVKVKDFKAKIRAVDALLIVTPEHNYSVPGVLKNAIDWASRPADDNSFEDKPAAIMSASTGMFGGVRAQLHLRQVLLAVGVYVLNRPEVMVPFAGEKIDENGNLTDEKTRKRIRQLLEKLVEWTKRLEQS